MQNNSYTVIINKNGDSTEQAISQLARLFKTTPEKSRKILQQDHFTVKKQLDQPTAEKLHKAIAATGINCQIEITLDEEDTELPSIEEIENTARVKPLLDITQPEIAPLHEEQPTLSLANGPVENDPVEKASAETGEDKAIEDIDPENFCPNCGTIRASADSNCVHCGFDPQVFRKKNIRSVIIKSLAGLVVLVIAGFLSFPWYQQYSKEQQVIDDLQLAFDTRNTITAFIEKTNFWPNQNIDAELPKQLSNRSITSIIVSENATITVTFKAEATNSPTSDTVQTLIFTARTLKGRTVWNCRGGTLEKKYRPDICKARVIED